MQFAIEDESFESCNFALRSLFVGTSAVSPNMSLSGS